MSKKVLVAEDNELNMKLITDLLSMRDVEIVQAWDGEEVLTKIAQTDFDLLLLDIQLPKVSGYEILKKINKDIPTIIISAYAQTEEISKISRFKYLEYITKPINVVSFLEKLDYILK